MTAEKRFRIKLGIDCAAAILLPFQISLVSQKAALGSAIASCYLLGVLLNLQWFQTLFSRGWTSPDRLALNVTRLLLLLSIPALGISAAFSRSILFGGAAKKLHIFFAYWELLLMGLSVGMTFSGILSSDSGFARRCRFLRYLFRAAGAAGAYGFIYLRTYEFLFFPLAEKTVAGGAVSCLAHFGVLALFIELGAVWMLLIKRVKKAAPVKV